MTYAITIADVKDGFATPIADSDLEGFIAIADTADPCLTRNEVADPVGQQLKRLFVRHMATIQRDGGAITSEKAVSGASRGYGEMKNSETGYLNSLKQLDSYGCVYSLAVSNAPLQLRSIGRRPERRSTY